MLQQLSSTHELYSVLGWHQILISRNWCLTPVLLSFTLLQQCHQLWFLNTVRDSSQGFSSTRHYSELWPQHSDSMASVTRRRLMTLVFICHKQFVADPTIHDLSFSIWELVPFNVLVETAKIVLRRSNNGKHKSHLSIQKDFFIIRTSQVCKSPFPFRN